MHPDARRSDGRRRERGGTADLLRDRRPERRRTARYLVPGDQRPVRTARFAADQPAGRSQNGLCDPVPFGFARLPAGVLPSDLLGLANDKMLSAILGGAVAGAGVSICFMQGGNSGGMDIIAMIINKYKTISYGRILMTIDMITIGCSIFVLGEVSAAIYGFVMVATFGYTIDAVMAGQPPVHANPDRLAEMGRDRLAHLRRDAPRRDADRRAGLVQQKTFKIGNGGLPQKRIEHPFPSHQRGRSQRIYDLRQRDGGIRAGLRGVEKIASGEMSRDSVPGPGRIRSILPVLGAWLPFFGG